MGDAPDAEELRRVDIQKLKEVKARDDVGHGYCFELRTNVFMDNGKPRIFILSSKVTRSKHHLLSTRPCTVSLLANLTNHSHGDGTVGAGNRLTYLVDPCDLFVCRIRGSRPSGFRPWRVRWKERGRGRRRR